MIEEIMREALGDNYNRTRLPSTLTGAYGVWEDEIDTDGPDGEPPVIFHHDVTIELYAPKPDPAAEAKLEAAISARGLKWHKMDRVWITSEKMYETVYDFAYTEKRRV